MNFSFTWIDGGADYPRFVREGKFIVIKSGEDQYKILAGLFNEHKGIPVSYSDKKQIVGAGCFDKSGKTYDHYSGGYNITTPQNLIVGIQETFTKNAEHINAKWSAEATKEIKWR